MRMISMTCRVAATMLLAVAAFAHPNVNGTWTLVPERSTFNGMPALTTGTVTINSREHNIYISRHLAVDASNAGEEYNYSTDGREHATIHQGKEAKIKSWWDGDVLKVRTTQNGQVKEEQYHLSPDGGLVLTINSPEGGISTLLFRRQ